jgi:hypothetical protein
MSSRREPEALPGDEAGGAFAGRAGRWAGLPASISMTGVLREESISTLHTGRARGQISVRMARLTGQSLPSPMGWRGESLDLTQDHFAQ